MIAHSKGGGPRKFLRGYHLEKNVSGGRNVSHGLFSLVLWFTLSLRLNVWAC